jgi:peptidoglycan/xylan/chitin deacetylase (PgdA/CDA1 family)
MLRKLYLTFDTENFISQNSPWVLQKILEGLKRYDTQAIFFITGHMAEKLENFDAVVDLLGEHQIGYHSSSHSVHPRIFEFTDLDDYTDAYKVSLQRETAHINPLTGEVEGKGGILALRALFPRKHVTLFRAPGHCWAPPHLEALRDLGIIFDFSTELSNEAVTFKELTFYPHPIMGHWQGELRDYRTLVISLLRRKLAILTVHPSLLVNVNEWDSIYFYSNPKQLLPPKTRSTEAVRHLLRSFNLLLKQIDGLRKMHIVETAPNLRKADRTLFINKSGVATCYQKSIRWALGYGYEPKFLLRHFLKFFEITANT